MASGPITSWEIDGETVEPCGKASWEALRESHRSLDPREGKRDTAATAREESARACPQSRLGLTPLGNAPSPHSVLIIFKIS